MKKFIRLFVIGLFLGGFVAYSGYVKADSTFIDFETYLIGNIDGQDGWSKTGPFDSEVESNTYSLPEFGTKVLRISNSITSGSFGDQTFTKSLVDEAGETTAVNSGFSGGIRSDYFKAGFDFSSSSLDEQPGLNVVISPDRGDGARMSWVQINDTPTGLEVNFYDYVTGYPLIAPSCCDGFRYSNLASDLPRDVAHHLEIEMEFVDGPANDVVRIYLDGNLLHTGTSWEDYFRDWQPAIAPPTVDSLLFRVAGTSAPETEGEGLIFDNIALTSDRPVPVTTVAKFNGGGHLLEEEGKRKDWLDVSFGGWWSLMSDESMMGDFQVNLHNVGKDGFDKSKFHGTDLVAVNLFESDSETCDDAVNFTFNGTWDGMPGYSMIFRAGDLGSPNTEDTVRIEIFNGENAGGSKVYDSHANGEFTDESSCVGTARTGLDSGNLTIWQE